MIRPPSCPSCCRSVVASAAFGWNTTHGVMVGRRSPAGASHAPLLLVEKDLTAHMHMPRVSHSY